MLLMPYLTIIAKKFVCEVKEMLNIKSYQPHLISELRAPRVSEPLKWDDGRDHLGKDITVIYIYTVSPSQIPG